MSVASSRLRARQEPPWVLLPVAWALVSAVGFWATVTISGGLGAAGIVLGLPVALGAGSVIAVAAVVAGKWELRRQVSRPPTWLKGAIVFSVVTVAAELVLLGVVWLCARNGPPLSWSQTGGFAVVVGLAAFSYYSLARSQNERTLVRSGLPDAGAHTESGE